MSTLNLVLLFPMMFILHDVEEILVQHRWILSHRERLMLKFPSMRSMVEHLSRLNTRAFALAAAEELLLIVLATGYVLSDGAYGVEIWSALFMAFFIHLWVHLLQAVMVRGYVPGLITSCLLLPFTFIMMKSMMHLMNGWELMAWGILGVVFMAANLRLAHWLGIHLCK